MAILLNEVPVSEAYYSITQLIERLHRRYLDVLRSELNKDGVKDINPVQCLLLMNIGDEEINVRNLMDRGYYQGSNASYNIKKRTHLALTEVRGHLSYPLQFACFVLDAVLWIVFAGIVIFYTVEQTWLAYDNFAIVGGTDNVMEWWFYTATPLAWGLIIVRVLQNGFFRYRPQFP